MNINRFLGLLGVLLLILNGVGAIYGGGMLMLDPTGSTIHLSPELIRGSRFSNYFIPGLLLFVFNGLFSLASAVSGMMGIRQYSSMLLLQGLILTVWLVVQVNIMKHAYIHHYAMGLVAGGLIAVGLLIRDKNLVGHQTRVR